MSPPGYGSGDPSVVIGVSSGHSPGDPSVVTSVSPGYGTGRPSVVIGVSPGHIPGDPSVFTSVSPWLQSWWPFSRHWCLPLATVLVALQSSLVSPPGYGPGGPSVVTVVSPGHSPGGPSVVTGVSPWLQSW